MADPRATPGEPARAPDGTDAVPRDTAPRDAEQRDGGSDADVARRILDECRIFAVVGASPDPSRHSHGVMRTLLAAGYDVVPVRPGPEELLGRACYPTLEAVPHPVDVVDVFRRSDRAGAHVDEAIEIGAKAVWLQRGVIDGHAIDRARAAGLLAVMDRCPATELERLGRI